MRAVMKTKAGRERANSHLTDENPRLKWLKVLAVYLTHKEWS
jgi:hypothetical protein